MSIKIEVNNGQVSVSSVLDTYNTPVDLEDKEREAFEIIKNILIDCDIDVSTLKVVSRSKDYKTLTLDPINDFCRIHFGIRSSWFSIRLISYAKEFENDPRFSAVKKKNVFHWKVPVKHPTEILQFKDVFKKEVTADILTCTE